MNVLSMHELIGVYKHEGYEWLCKLREVLAENIDYAYDYIIDNFKDIKIFKPQGTYMLYLDCKQWCKNHNITMNELYKAGTDAGVACQDGRPFNYPYAIRLNLALPKSLVIEAFERLKKYVFKD
jgi:cystathionine beta-lyase